MNCFNKLIIIIIVGNTNIYAQGWTLQTFHYPVYDLHFANMDTGWVACGYIVKTFDGGVTWNYSAGIEKIRSLSFINSTTGWAVGNEGKIVKTTDGGKHWQTQDSGTTYDLWTVSFADSSTGWAGGQDLTGMSGIIIINPAINYLA